MKSRLRAEERRVAVGHVMLALVCVVASACQAKAKRVEFELSDAYGRIISSEDYKGVPIFLEFGACW